MSLIYFVSQVIGDIDNLLARFSGHRGEVTVSIWPRPSRRVGAAIFSGRTAMFIDQVDRSDAKFHRGLRVRLSCDCMQLKST